MVVPFPPKSPSFQAAIPFLSDHCDQDLTDKEPTPWPSFQGQTSSADDIKRYFIYSSLLLSQLFLLIIISLYSIIGTVRKTTLNPCPTEITSHARSKLNISLCINFPQQHAINFFPVKMPNVKLACGKSYRQVTLNKQNTKLSVKFS